MKINYFPFIFLIFLLSINTVTQAVPAYPNPVAYIQPDKSVLTITLHGDEKVRWARSEDGYTLLLNNEGYYEYAKSNENGDLVSSGIRAKNIGERSGEAISILQKTEKELFYSQQQVSLLKSMWKIDKMEGEKAFPATGTHKLVCILVEFADVHFNKTPAEFYNLFNQIGYTTGGATGSVRDFYSEVSYNQLNLITDVAGPYRVSQNRAYYGENQNGYDMRPREMVTEALYLANPDINFAEYDNDNDGYVDAVYIIFAGHGEEAGAPAEAIWSHAWSIPRITLDGKYISRYSCSPELRGNSGTNLTRIGVICHEFGHVLGAPDFYDTDYSSSGGNFTGTGNWDVMAHGSWNNSGATPAHHNAYTKVYVYNWANALLLNSPTTLTVYNSVFHSNSFYRYNTTTSKEFFLMETRVKKGFDANIPGEGLIVYHVHSNIASGTAANTINTGHPQMMYPVCASATSNPGSSPSNYGSINSAGCPFPGSNNKTSFTDATTPAARSWAGANTNRPLTNIMFYGATDAVTLDFMGGSSVIAGDNCFNPVVLNGVSGSFEYTTTDFTDNHSGSCNNTGNDQVFSLGTALNSSDMVKIWITDSDYDAVLYATYGNCDGNEIGCILNTDEDTLLWINNTDSQQYVWIFVDGYNHSNGSATLNWEIITPATVDGNDCTNPIVLSGTSGSFQYTTAGATDNFSSGCGGLGSEDLVFYLDTPVPAGRTIHLSCTSNTYNVVLYARYGSCTGNEVACTGDPHGAETSWTNTTGRDQYVWIFADGSGESSGTATLTWNINGPGPEGDVCENPRIVTGIENSIPINTIGYNNNYEGSCESSGPDQVILLGTGIGTGKILRLWTSEEDYNTVMYARYGSCYGQEIGCITGPGSIIEWENNTGNPQMAWIFIDGVSEDKGYTTLHWQISSPNVAENYISSQAILYPNPASDEVHIEFSEEGQLQQIYIYNCLGVPVLNTKAGNVSASRTEISLSKLPEGSYFVDIHLTGSVIRKKLLIVR